MKGFALFLIFIAACFALTHMMVSDHGYVLMAYNRMTFESSLWGLLLLVFLAMLALMLVRGVAGTLMGMAGMIYPMSAKARKKRARRLFDRGLAEFSKGHWKKSERLLAQAAKAGEASLVNYLAAAKAAHKAGNSEASAAYLRQADSRSSGAEMAISITQAQIQLSGNHLEQALATLKHLHQKHPRHVYILKLLRDVYIRLHDWEALAKLLPKLRKLKVMNEEQWHELQQKIYEALFEQALQRGQSAGINEDRTRAASHIWSELNAVQKRNTGIIYRYAKTLSLLGADEQAERVLRQNLPHNYSDKMVRLYGKLKGRDITKQLKFAEALLNERTNDPDLLLSLGRLALRNELWGKAKEYLEASLKLKKSVDVYNELGQLLASLGDYETSARYFQEGLALAADNVAGLPHPGKGTIYY